MGSQMVLSFLSWSWKETDVKMVVWAMLLTLFIGCHKQAKTPPGTVPGPVAQIPTQSEWRFDPQNPVLRFGELRTLGTWNDPCVLKSETGYVMYLTTSMQKPGSPPVQPFRAVSADGRKWRLEPETPLMAPGAAGSFDSSNVETPSVVRYKGQYHLYYTGVGDKGLVGPMSIGHAVSDDGIHWTKDPNPVLAPTGKYTDWNGFQAAEPAAVVFQDRIYLYFAAVGLRQGGTPPASRVIGLATSENGRAFSAPEPALKPNDLYPPQKGFDGYSTPAAAVIQGKMHLFYDVGYFDDKAEHKWVQVALHHAASSVGRGGWTQDPKAIVRLGQARWLGMEVRAPAPLFDGTRLRLWFAGNADPSEFIETVQKTGRSDLFGIGYAELTGVPK